MENLAVSPAAFMESYQVSFPAIFVNPRVRFVHVYLLRAHIRLLTVTLAVEKSPKRPKRFLTQTVKSYLWDPRGPLLFFFSLLFPLIATSQLCVLLSFEVAVLKMEWVEGSVVVCWWRLVTRFVYFLLYSYFLLLQKKLLWRKLGQF